MRATPLHSRGTLLWDDDCAFCARAIGVLHRLARSELDAQPARNHLGILPPQVAQTAADQVIWIDGSGSVCGGVTAIGAALRAAGRPGLAWLLTNPAVAPFARAAYRWIARNRHKLAASGSACARERH